MCEVDRGAADDCYCQTFGIGIHKAIRLGALRTDLDLTGRHRWRNKEKHNGTRQNCEKQLAHNRSRPAVPCLGTGPYGRAVLSVCPEGLLSSAVRGPVPLSLRTTLTLTAFSSRAECTSVGAETSSNVAALTNSAKTTSSR